MDGCMSVDSSRARMLHRLSARRVATATKAGYLPDGGGLYLQVLPSGAKSWIFRFRFGARRPEMGLGSLQNVSLAEARDAAAEARKQVASGLNPIDQRRNKHVVAAGIPTFEEAAKKLIASLKPGWKNAKHADQWSNTLATYAYPVIGAKKVDAIETEDVLQILTPIWLTKTETATRVRQRIEAILDASKAKRQRSGENPARWKGHLDKLLPKPADVSRSEHFAAMPYRDVPAFMKSIANDAKRSAAALRFTILTAVRTNEAVGATWDEFDLKERVWRIPKARMKSEKRMQQDHEVPLSVEAIKVLEKLPRSRPPFAMSENTMLYFLQRPAPKGMGQPFTVHGFRSSFRDWAAEETDAARDVVEMALAHAIKDKTEAAYRRGNLLAKRRVLMDAWAAYCCQSIKRRSTISASDKNRRFYSEPVARGAETRI